MRILAVNAGSSSVKLSVIGDGDVTEAAITLGPPGDAATDHDVTAFIDSCGPCDAAGHRIVHGGPDFHSAVVIDGPVRRRLEGLADLAPLHVPAALRIVDMVRVRIDVPQVACFDTAFHRSLPDAATTYAIPPRWRSLGVRRYGFHGLSCAWSLRRAAGLLGRRAEDLRLVVAHLGSGASVTAIRSGHSMDTSMGFTPLEGLVMALRSGSVDPGALLWLQLNRGVPAQDMSDALEHSSGLYALAGTGDMREILLRAHAGNDAAALARDVYVHRLRATVAAVAASLDRVDALVFTGGVGENAADIRDRACRGLGVIGVQAPARPASDSVDSVISAEASPVAVLLVHAREDLEVVKEVRSLLHPPDLRS